MLVHQLEALFRNHFVVGEAEGDHFVSSVLSLSDRGFIIRKCAAVSVALHPAVHPNVEVVALHAS